MLYICVLADVIHFVKILMLCNTFFAFPKREFDHNWLMHTFAGIVMGVMSAII